MVKRMKTKLSVGDKVVLKDYITVCKHRKVSPNNEVFQRHYDYMKKKEPLTISKIIEPGSVVYDPEEHPDISKRGQPIKERFYVLPTPRSQHYIYEGCELELYKEESTDEE